MVGATVIVDLGDTVETEAEVTSSLTGALVDPDEPLFRVLRPDGETEDIEVDHVSEGKFRCTYNPAEEGDYVILFAGEGEYRVAGELRFRVRKPKVPRD